MALPSSPTLFFSPSSQECRLRDLSYTAPVSVDVRYSRGGQICIARNVHIGRIPIMLRSSRCILRNLSDRQLEEVGECPYDPGGYFVCKGVEKVILIQEQLSKNRIIIELDSKGNLCAQVTSSTALRKSRTVIGQKNGRIQLIHNTIGEDIPVVIFLRAMGCTSDQEILSLIGSEPKVAELMAASLEEAAALGVFTTAQALDYIGGKVKTKKGIGAPFASRASLSKADEARNILANIVLAHVPVVGFNFRPKVIYAAHMIRRIILTQIGVHQLDDKDYYGNKRLELAGQLMALLFEDCFKRFNADLQRVADSTLARKTAEPFDILRHFRPDTITTGMLNAVSTGNWILKRFRMERLGVTQQLSRMSYIGALGMMTRVTSQFEKTRKVSGPRALQPSQWGMLCPSDTPEGEACGLVKNLALLSHVTVDEDPVPLERLAYALGTEDVESLTGEEMCDLSIYTVFLNGLILGAHRLPFLFAARLRALRRRGLIGSFVSIFVHEGHKAVHIASDGGRICRPLIIVDQTTKKPLLTKKMQNDILLGLLDFNALLRNGIVEYVDVNEENNVLVALREGDIGSDTSHLEIDPMTILGVVTGLIPYPHHNQSPRNTYQCAMGKQAMGTVAANQQQRTDTVLYLLTSPQKPMLRTHVIDMISFDELPAGQNAIVAIMSYSGYDIEDAIVLNRGSMQRGYGRCMLMRKHVTQIKKYPNGTQDRLAPPPDPASSAKAAALARRMAHLDTEGLPLVGERLVPNSVLINKDQPVNTVEHCSNPDIPEGGYRAAPVVYRAAEDGIVDRVMLTSTPTDHLLIKVMLRHVRQPELGDKFSSRHGQKGVVGLIAPQTDMPFNDAGICPDMIMNPHGFPSRMTVGKMIELVGSKAGLLDGHRRYGSAFSGDPLAESAAALAAAGYHYAGKEILTSGITGELVKGYIFFGPIYYQKLKHMVLDKMHARARGPRAVLTRQPTEGRSRDGGLRLGEMERDCLIGYGTSALLQERLMLSSDVFDAEVCSHCGLLGTPGWCQFCRSREHMVVLRMPYAAKLLFQELTSMNVIPRIVVGTNN